MAEPYKFYIDKPTTFECKLELEGASLDNTVARLVVECANRTLLFTGTVSPNGLCKIPVGKLKGIMEENTSGTVKLEVIAEDVYFQPWETQYEVVAEKRLTVEVASQKPKKPSLSVEPKVTPAKPLKPASRIPSKLEEVLAEITTELILTGITPSTMTKNKELVRKTIKECVDRAGLDIEPTSLIPTVVKLLAH